MIQLEFMKKSTVYREKVVLEHYESIAKSSRKIRELDKWCDYYLDSKLFDDKKFDSKTKSFEKVVRSDLKKLIEIRDYIRKNKIVMDEKLKKYIINTVYTNNIDRIKFIESLGVTVCPYCNRNFINSKKNRTSCQFDHFINKSDFPILAVSFYNLVPVCPSCNHIKSDKDFSYSPYNQELSADKMLRFSYIIKDLDYLKNPKSIEILINTIGKKSMDENTEILGLRDLYQVHSDVVQELIMRKMIYVDEYILQMYKKFPGLFSRNEIERLITGSYVNEEHYGKRPLSKLVADISREIKLIKEK